MEELISIQTANGVTTAEWEATIFVKDMDDYVDAILLEDAPPVLSLGKLCLDHGWSYSWEAGSELPTLKKG